MNNGTNASKIFGGKSESFWTKKLYSESADLMSATLRKHLSIRKPSYKLADYGSHRGELLGNMLQRMPEYSFQTFGIDIDEKALIVNPADQKINCDLTKIPATDGYFDTGICRYVLVWNSWEKQKQIITEIARTCCGPVIIQHASQFRRYSDNWFNNIDRLLSGREVPKLKRENYYFSTGEEIEKFMKESNIPYRFVESDIVHYVSDSFKDRFNLSEEEGKKVVEILGKQDRIHKQTWLIFGKEFRKKTRHYNPEIVSGIYETWLRRDCRFLNEEDLQDQGAIEDILSSPRSKEKDILLSKIITRRKESNSLYIGGFPWAPHFGCYLSHEKWRKESEHLYQDVVAYLER